MSVLISMVSRLLEEHQGPELGRPDTKALLLQRSGIQTQVETASYIIVNGCFKFK